MIKRINQANFIPFPEVVRIEPASICNLKCIHCPTGIGKSKDRGVMSEKTFRIILRNLKKLKIRVVVMYHGGEPFLNKRIFEWISTIKSIGVGLTKVVTNGILLKDDMLIRIVESGLDSIEFSIDGQSPEENNRIRIGSNYYQVANTIKKLIRIKEEKSSNKPAIFICNTQFIDSQKKFPTARYPSTPEFILNDFSGIYEGQVTFKNTWALYWPGLKSLKRNTYVKAKQKAPFIAVNHCPHLSETITIRWNGDVVPCCYDLTSKYVIGNIKESGLVDIWNNKKYKKIRKSIYDKRYLSLCSNCHVIRPQQFLRTNYSIASYKKLNPKG